MWDSVHSFKYGDMVDRLEANNFNLEYLGYLWEINVQIIWLDIVPCSQITC